MRLVKLRDNVWINSDQLTHITFDATKTLTYFFLQGTPDPITVNMPLEEALRRMGVVEVPQK